VQSGVSGWVLRFWHLPLLAQCTVIVFLAVLGTLFLTLIFYSIFFSDRLLLDLFLSAVIAIVVGYPLAYIFLRQSVRLMHLAEELERISTTDDLTQLANRKTFLDRTRGLIASAPAGSSAGILLFIDADHFKTLNDTWGHHAGDEVLRRLGRAIKSSVGEKDVAGRLGGEEFAVFLIAGDKEAAEQACGRIKHAIASIPREVGLEAWRLTVSVGVARHRPGQEIEDILRAADKSLYEAKYQGRNRVVHYREPDLAA
jgi:diguanylate cyclase (GGDEF)-like protein